MPSRQELKTQKEKTSQSLIRAALQLCAEEGYASLSLRSVARKAGIAPTSFYRHFREIDEMGVEMIAQAKAVLDDCLARIGEKMTFPRVRPGDPGEYLAESIECVTRPFIEIFLGFFASNDKLLHLFFQERTGSSEAMRRSISEAADRLTAKLARNLQQLSRSSGNTLDDIPVIAEAMITIAGFSGMEMFARPEEKPGDIAERTIRKLDLLLTGAVVRGQADTGGRL